MIPAAVRYVRPGSLEEALAALAEPDAKPLAGGQSLVSVMKLRIARPELVVDISHLELEGIETRDGTLRIGALTTWSDLAVAPELRRPALAALAECAAGIGDLQVRNRGTVRHKSGLPRTTASGPSGPRWHVCFRPKAAGRRAI